MSKSHGYAVHPMADEYHLAGCLSCSASRDARRGRNRAVPDAFARTVDGDDRRRLVAYYHRPPVGGIGSCLRAAPCPASGSRHVGEGVSERYGSCRAAVLIRPELSNGSWCPVQYYSGAESAFADLPRRQRPARNRFRRVRTNRTPCQHK